MSKGILKKIGLFFFVILLYFTYQPKDLFAQGGPTDLISSQQAAAAEARSQKLHSLDPQIIQARNKINLLENELKSAQSYNPNNAGPLDLEPRPIPNIQKDISDEKYRLDTLTDRKKNIYIEDVQAQIAAWQKTNGDYAAKKIQELSTDLNKYKSQSGTEFQSEQEAIVAAEKAKKDAAALRASNEVRIICPAWGDRESTAGWVGDSIMCGISKISYLILTIFSKLLSMVGKLFNGTTELFIVNMKSTLGLCSSSDCNPKTDIVSIGWSIFRDISNILFIFVLIYISIKTILGGTGETAKSISTVIVVAVLINFSMFFTKVIIDITNTLAVSFYNSITEYSVDHGFTKSDEDTGESNGIAQPFITQTKIATIYGTVKKSAEGGATELNYTSITVQSLMGTVFLIILTFILLLMTVMIISRFIILAFIIMTSSIAFGACILPGLKSKITDKWWDALIGQSLFAPVFLLFLYITLVFLSNFQFGTTGGFADILNTGPQTLIGYAVTVGMLITSMKVAKSLSDQAGAASGKITGFLGGAALGVAGFAARGVLGGAGGKLLDKIAGDRDTKLMRALRAGGKKLSTSSFDIRSSKKFESLNKAIGGVEVGDAGGKGGFDKWREETALNAVLPSKYVDKKYIDKEVKEHEKEYKDAGKFESDKKMKDADGKDTNYTEQEAVNVHEERKKYNNEIAKLKKQKKDSDQNDLETQDAIQKQIDKKQAKLDEHKHEHGNDIEVSERREAADGAAKKRQNEFLESRHSAAGKEFAKQQRAKNAKEKTDVDKLLEGLKAQSGGGDKKPAEGGGDKDKH